MRKSKKSNRSLKDYSNIIDWIICLIIAFGMLFGIIVMPCTVAYGVASGYLDIETLRPIRNEVQYEGY